MTDAISDEAIGQAVVDYIISAGLYSAQCANGCDVGCVITWTANAQTQIGQRVKELLAEDLVP